MGNPDCVERMKGWMGSRWVKVGSLLVGLVGLLGLGETPPVGLLGLGETPHVGLLGLGETPRVGPSTWVSGEFVSLTNLTKSAHRHQDSAAHLQAANQLDEQRHHHTTAYNNKVRQNREILKRLINVVTFLGKQELAFRGYESKGSENKGNYLELLEFLAGYDGPLRCHLDSATVFISTSSKIQNDLIQSVADMTEAMREEVRNTPFV
ncbi:Zinc finger MYM-type protein 1 [Merluccius polli]|uniref:Zinc finger MYM-type protein 1 n=1 Tax=Merluccius polli TaxID=89951 RepID=A0AA47M0U0_MERPO|nr:Zinc finger MYM-type protein 1 [Merluccius polli]